MDTPLNERGSLLRETHLRDYWKVVWQGRLTVLAVFLVVTGATAIWSFLQVPVYRSTAIVEVQPQSRGLAAGQDVSGIGAGGYGWFAEEKYHNTQVEIIKSRDIATRVVDRLRLREHPDLIETDDPVDLFRRKIRVEPRRDTGLIEISMMGTDPDEITQWVNTVAEAYVRRNLEKAKENMQESIDAIKEQMDTFKSNLVAREADRVETLQDQKIFNSENQQDIVAEKLRTLNASLTEVLIEENRLRRTLSRIEELRRNDGDLLSLPELGDDETLRALLKDRVGIERELESAKVDLRPGHPDYEKLTGQLSTIEQRIHDRTSLALGTLNNRLDAAEQQERYLRNEIDEAEAFSLEVVRATSLYDIVKTDADAAKTVIDLISRALNEVQLGAQLMSNNVSLLDLATPPRFAVKPRKKLNVMMGGFFGLFLGLSLVFFLDYLDNTFRTPEDIEKYLGLAVLGVIPKLNEEGVKARAVKEAYQSLRTSIIFSSKNRERKILLVTSTGPQEGKSSTVANLGRTLAQAGERVIILDCDLRRPTQHSHLEADREHGLTNYLAAPADRADWRIYTKTAGPNNLHVLTCGPIPPSPPELLGSERFRELLETLRETYDWVLLDSPPASSLADATLLAALADMVVVVVRHNRTDRDLVAKSMTRIAAVQPNIAGVVLNNVDLDRAYDKDYYYSGYYYLSDDEAGTKTKKKKKKSQDEAKVS